MAYVEDLTIRFGTSNSRWLECQSSPYVYQHWARTVERFDIWETNDRGFRLLEFANSHRLTLAYTFHPNKLSGTANWHAPIRPVHNQIDFILTLQSFKSSINSDHDLVLTTLKFKLKTKCSTKSPRIRFDLEKLKRPKIAEEFQAKVGGKFAAHCIFDSDVDTHGNGLKEGLLPTTEEVFGRQSKKIQPWVTNEFLDLCDQRRRLKQQKYTSTEAGVEYRKVNWGVRKKMKAAKERWIEEQCKNVEKGIMSGNGKKAWNTIKAFTKTQRHKSAVIEGSSGNILTEGIAVLNQWTEYCGGLYNYELYSDTSLLQSNQTPTLEAESLPVLREEVEEVVRSLKVGKSPGADNIPSKLLKNGGEATTTVLTVTCKKIGGTKEWPKEWTQSLVIPLQK